MTSPPPVPTALIAPHIHRYINGETDGVAATRLATESGVSLDLLYRIAAGKRTTILFNTADAILCAVGEVDAWNTDPELRVIADALMVRVGDRVHVRGAPGYWWVRGAGVRFVRVEKRRGGRLEARRVAWDDVAKFTHSHRSPWREAA